MNEIQAASIQAAATIIAAGKYSEENPLAYPGQPDAEIVANTVVELAKAIYEAWVSEVGSEPDE